MPVIFHAKDDELDEALGLGLEADDYITKPFSQDCYWHIQAVLRRASAPDMNEQHAQIIRQRG